MPSSSNQAAYGGETPPKPDHRFSHNTASGDALRQRRLDEFTAAPDSAPRASSNDPRGITAARRAQTAAALDDIARRLG
ncbi:hypothetical protein GGR56DRAFT_675728 [Xylariaceae sp. FL0804]|nr:hypothetical protein GGR56DRAFT_675728 [Xylariaceae sp. FL0804]